MKLSVVIAAHDRPDSLIRLLASLKPQLAHEGWEVLIAQNGTPAPTPIPPALEPVVHLHDPRPGKCRAQNRAIAQAHGDIIVCVDDDVEAAPRYLDAVGDFFRDHPEFAAMKGRTLPLEDPVAKVGAGAAYLDLPIVDHGKDVVEVRGVLGANMAFRADALRQAGPFDERLGPGAAGHEEETEMSARLRRMGFRIGYAPEALVYHEVDPARADRVRFIRIARERGRARTLHESHSALAATTAVSVAAIRLAVARFVAAHPERLAREEKRLAIARGMLDGLRDRGGTAN